MNNKMNMVLETAPSHDYDDFYTVTVRNDEIVFQGDYSGKKVLKYTELGYDFKIAQNGFTEAKMSKGNYQIRITLT